MKNLRIIFFVLLIFLINMPNSYAQKYDGLDMNISLDEWWFVFTRDNLNNNQNLSDLGISKDYMENFFAENDAYLDAIYFYNYPSEDYLEFVVYKYDMNNDENLKKFKNIKNLKNAKKADIGHLGIMLGEEEEITNTIVYETDDLLFLKNYYELDDGYQLSYITIYNKQYYILNFTSNNPIDDTMESITDAIIDEITVDNINSNINIIVIFSIIIITILLFTTTITLKKKKKS